MAIAFFFTLAFVTFAATAVITDMIPASSPAEIEFVWNSTTSDFSASYLWGSVFESLKNRVIFYIIIQFPANFKDFVQPSCQVPCNNPPCVL